MPVKQYMVPIDDALVEEAKRYYISLGAKLSPLINSLLLSWVKKQRKMLSGKEEEED